MEYEVIIVDDDDMCLFLHKTIIERTKFHASPQTFDSAEKALDFFEARQDRAKPVVMFLDINMPVMNGWDFLERLHADGFNNDVYVVMVSSSVDYRDKKRAFSFTKVIDYAEKPFGEEVLQRADHALAWLKDGKSRQYT